MSSFEFGGIIASDRSGCINRNGETVKLKAWPLVGTWTTDSPELEALRQDYGDAATIREDRRGVYLEVVITVCSVQGIRNAERKLASRMFQHLSIAVTIQ